MLACFLLVVSCWVIGVSLWVAWLFWSGKGRSALHDIDVLARSLEASGDDWRELWEGRLDWPSFETRFRARLAVEEGRRAPFNEGWLYELVALGLEFVGMVLGVDGERGRRRRRLMVRELSRL